MQVAVLRGLPMARPEHHKTAIRGKSSACEILQHSKGIRQNWIRRAWQYGVAIPRHHLGQIRHLLCRLQGAERLRVVVNAHPHPEKQMACPGALGSGRVQRATHSPSSSGHTRLTALTGVVMAPALPPAAPTRTCQAPARGG